MRFSKKQITILSLINVFVIGVLCYIDGNFRYTLINDTGLYSQIEKRYKIFSIDNELPDSVLLVNVSYDQILVPEINEYGDTIGNTCITDREKLCDFVKLLNTFDNYRKVIFDIRFEDTYSTDFDSRLFDAIGKCRDIVLPVHRSKSNALPKTLSAKMGYSDYANTLYQSSFVKYEFVQKGQPSMAALLCPTSIDKWFGASFCNRWPAYNCPSISMRINPTRFEQNEYLNLGSDMLSDSTLFETLVNDRIIVVGNMQTDKHTTYAGTIPGSVITLNAYLTLCKGDHIISLWYVVMWSVVLFMLSYLTIADKSFEHLLSHVCKIKSDLFWFGISMFGYSSIVSAIASALYIGTGYMSNIAIPTFYMSIFSLGLKYKRKRK